MGELSKQLLSVVPAETINLYTKPLVFTSNPCRYQGFDHGDNRTRTCDPLHVKQMLSQLSYVSQSFSKTKSTGSF